MAATRVYILAKELGVKSTAIVKKCQDEGLDVKNHMSSISAGLAATIHEWFSEGDNVTTVETSEKVNLKKVRVRKKKPKPAEQKVTVKKQKKAKTADVEAETKEAEAEAVEVVEDVVEEKEPEPIVPAGPILEKPGPAQLAGPKVVRVEAPEPVRPIRPRQRAK
ncbi:MAG: translation initiation factor IF-2 N-terminal domain-containing protein, partial [Planctomycetota bacterium]